MSPDWKLLHNNAITGPRPGAEAGIVSLLRGWLAYADAYEAQFSYSTSREICYDTRDCPRDEIGEGPGCTECAAYFSDGIANSGVNEDDTEHFYTICQSCNDCNGGRIGSDGVLGVAWAKIGHQLLTLLCGDLGRLDGGTLDHIIRQAFELAGLDENGEEE
jgi:5-methylcytosine-specific restriction endonuclease McrA